MLKLSESALVPKMTNLLTAKGRQLFGNRTVSAKQSYNIVNKPARSFESTQAIAHKEHPIVGFKEDATRDLVKHKKGLIGKPMNEMHDFHAKRSAPKLGTDPKPDLHPTEPTTDTRDWHHKEEPTLKTYRRIKGAVKQVNAG